MIDEIKIKGTICFVKTIYVVYPMGVRRTKNAKKIKKTICFDLLEHPEKLNQYINEITKEN